MLVSLVDYIIILGINVSSSIVS